MHGMLLTSSCALQYHMFEECFDTILLTAPFFAMTSSQDLHAFPSWAHWHALVMHRIQLSRPPFAFAQACKGDNTRSTYGTQERLHHCYVSSCIGTVVQAGALCPGPEGEGCKGSCRRFWSGQHCVNVPHAHAALCTGGHSA